MTLCYGSQTLMRHLFFFLSLILVSKQKKIELEANEFLQGKKNPLAIYKLEGVVNKGMGVRGGV